MHHRRPAMTAALLIGGGIVAAHATGAPWGISAAAAVTAVLAATVAVLRRRRRPGRALSGGILAMAALFFAAAADYGLREQTLDPADLRLYRGTADSLRIRCRVADEPRESDGRLRFLAAVYSLAGEFDTVQVSGKAYVTVLPDRLRNGRAGAVRYGDHLELYGLLVSPSGARNPGEFSYRDYLALNNIHAEVTVRSRADLQRLPVRDPHWLFEYLIHPSKAFIVSTITAVMTGDAAYFLIGLLLGDRTELSEEIKNAFMNTGTIHVLAVSGSHVILVVTIIFVILGLLRFPPKWRIAATLVVLVYYTFLTGASPSVVRASIMSGIVLTGKLFERRTDVYNVLGLSAVIMFVYDPNQLFDVGFQLSFSAVFSMVYFYPKLEAAVGRIPEPLEEFRLVTPVWQLFAVSLAAQIGTLPFTAYYFGRVSVVSLFANLLVVPVVGAIVTVGLTGAVLGVISMWAAAMFSEVNDLLAWFTLAFVRLAEQVPYASVDTSTFGWRETVIYSAVIAMLFHLRDARFLKATAALMMLFASALLFASAMEGRESALRVTFLDVGQGDCAVVRFPGGETYVIDAGPAGGGKDAGEDVVAPFLRRQGVSRIDAVITTHPHADHMGGVPALLRGFEVLETIDPGQPLNSRLYGVYDALERDLPQTTARAGMVRSVSGVRVYFLHPTERNIDRDSTDGYSDVNDVSVVMKVVYGSVSFLFMGDAEAESEREMTATYGGFMDADVLKAGHHGSSTSSTEELVESVTPAHAVISVARFNKFRHPSRKVIERFERAGAAVHRTDRDGAVVMETDGVRLTVRHWKER